MLYDCSDDADDDDADDDDDDRTQQYVQWFISLVLCKVVNMRLSTS